MVFVSMSTEQLVDQLDNFHTPDIRRVVPMHRHILHRRLVAHVLVEDHDSLAVDMAVENIVEVVVDFVEDIPSEEGLEDILDYMLVVPWAVHVRAALAVGIARIDLEAGNQELDRIVIDLAVVLLVVPHMVVGHLGKDTTFSLYLQGGFRNFKLG